MIKITLNEKEYILPNEWTDITIAQLQALNNIDVELDNITKNLLIVSILSGIDIDDLLDVPATEYNSICEIITFLDHQIPDKIKDEWTYDGITYKFDSEITKYSTGMFLDLDALSKESSENLHKLMAIMYRPLDTDGNITKYKSSELNKRAKLFQEFMTVDVAISAQVFFSVLVANCTQIMKASSNNQKKN